MCRSEWQSPARATRTSACPGPTSREASSIDVNGGGYVELHESKTVGDYLRELAARSVPWRGVFQEFARGYELVAYGGVRCDADRYGRLLGLAGRLAGRGG